MKRHSLSLIEVEKAFGTEKQCLDYAAAARWPDGVRCLKCGSDKVSPFTTNETEREVTNRKGEMVTRRVPARHLYQCNAEGCRHQFSAISGTIFTDTHLPLSTWFKAVALLANAKKGVSALQMQRDLGVNYRTAWHLNHRIREAMQSEQGLFGGTVEVDATFHGGRLDPRRKRAAYGKKPVAGVLQRSNESSTSKVRAFPVEKEIAKVMTGVIRDNVAIDAEVMTDEHMAYAKLTTKGWKHDIVAHSKEEWVRGNVHTQGIENFWSLFKRGVIGSFHQVSVKHLHRYLNEFTFRFNNREAENIFAMIVLSLVTGKPLRYDALTAPVSPSTSEPSASE
jgi:hypothetical protein